MLYRSAFELIRDAVGPTGRVELEKPPGATPLGDLQLYFPGERPRHVELRAWTGKNDNPPQAKDRSRVWVVSNASPELIRRLRAGERSFVDVKRGIVRLALPGMLVDRTDLQPPRKRSRSREMLDPFGDRASLVARVIVQQPARVWTTRAVAAEAGVSTMTASHVVRRLGELGVLDVQRTGRANSIRLRNLRRLIDGWTIFYDWERNVRLTVAAPVGNVDRFVRRLPSLLKTTRWALTLQAGASLVAPQAVWDAVHVYVDVPDERALEDVAHQAKWPVGDGKVVLMKPSYADSVWYGLQSRRGIPVVSELQLILDLWHYPVRGLEQAEHILRHIETAIGR